MKYETKYVDFKTLPNTLLDEIGKRLETYSVGLLKFRRRGSHEEADLIGSGTLIKIEQSYGILTAQHVVSLLNDSAQLGLGLMSDIHKYTIDTIFLDIIQVGKPQRDCRGPDLAVVILPQAKLGWIKALKCFWNISHWRQKILSNKIDLNIGVGVVCGFPEEHTKTYGPTKGFGQVKEYRGIWGFSRIERPYEDKQFDYFEVSVSYESTQDIPRTFGGVSGGGVWQVVLKQTKDGRYQFEDPILVGVAFYQTDMEHNKRRIICHGWRSIYDVVYNAVLRERT